MTETGYGSLHVEAFPISTVYVDGKKIATLRGADIANQFKAIVETYVKDRWGKKKPAHARESH